MSIDAVNSSGGAVGSAGGASDQFNKDLAFLSSYKAMLSQFKQLIEEMIQKIEKFAHDKKHAHNHVGNELVILIEIFLMVMQDKYGLHIAAEGKLQDAMSIIQGQFTTGMGIYHNMQDWDADPNKWTSEQRGQYKTFVDSMKASDSAGDTNGTILTELQQLVGTGFLEKDTFDSILTKVQGMKPDKVPLWNQFFYYAHFILNYQTPTNTQEVKRIADDSSSVIQSISGQNAQVKSTMQTLIGNHNEMGASANKMIQQLGKMEENANNKTGQH